MQRVMVIGCCGAGKSTFAKALHGITHLELLHLDSYYWKPNWVESDSESWKKTVQAMADKSNWIIDGTYGGTIDIRIKRADTIIYLDYPTWRCLWRIAKRIVKYWGTVRPDMPAGCEERFDLNFIHYVATFNFLKRDVLMKKVNAHRDSKQVHIIKNDEAVIDFLDKIRSEAFNSIL